MTRRWPRPATAERRPLLGPQWPQEMAALRAWVARREWVGVWTQVPPAARAVPGARSIRAAPERRDLRTPRAALRVQGASPAPVIGTPDRARAAQPAREAPRGRGWQAL